MRNRLCPSSPKRKILNKLYQSLVENCEVVTQRRSYKLLLEATSCKTLIMEDFTRTLNSVEELNGKNYGSWSMRMRYYCLGKKLWDIISGSNTTPRIDVESTKMWKFQIWKAMFVHTITIEDSSCNKLQMLRHPNRLGTSLQRFLKGRMTRD